MSDNKSNKGGSMSFLAILALIFIVLKLTRNIDWSWWLVLSPLWIPVVLFILGFIIYAVLKSIK